MNRVMVWSLVDRGHISRGLAYEIEKLIDEVEVLRKPNRGLSRDVILEAAHVVGLYAVQVRDFPQYYRRYLCVAAALREAGGDSDEVSG